MVEELTHAYSAFREIALDCIVTLTNHMMTTRLNMLLRIVLKSVENLKLLVNTFFGHTYMNKLSFKLQKRRIIYSICPFWDDVFGKQSFTAKRNAYQKFLIAFRKAICL